MSNQANSAQLQEMMQQAQEAFERFKKDKRLQVQLQAELERFKQDTSYLDEHRHELLDVYPEQWIAIYNQRVVGASPDYEQLLAQVKAKGIPLTRGVYEHLSRKQEVWIL